MKAASPTGSDADAANIGNQASHDGAHAAADATGSPDPEEAPADLPSIESLDASSDFTPFLRPGVPKALRLAALRRAWTMKPAISGHRPLVEYDWDFNAPGYGRLRPEDNAQKLVAGLFKGLRRIVAEGTDRALESPAEPPAALARESAAEPAALPPEGPTEVTEPPQHSTGDPPEPVAAEPSRAANGAPPPVAQPTRSQSIGASKLRAPLLPGPERPKEAEH